ncbi:MAG: hypothetical protein WCY19_07695, partial [Candidatus Gastranaerophilaceae bacterium]
MIKFNNASQIFKKIGETESQSSNPLYLHASNLSTYKLVLCRCVCAAETCNTELQSTYSSHVMLNLFQHRMVVRFCDPETS